MIFEKIPGGETFIWYFFDFTDFDEANTGWLMQA
jgi:hypothetical protein